jgi:hypothetical protein
MPCCLEATCYDLCACFDSSGRGEGQPMGLYCCQQCTDGRGSEQLVLRLFLSVVA